MFDSYRGRFCRFTELPDRVDPNGPAAIELIFELVQGSGERIAKG
jgi:hypothetical protein